MTRISLATAAIFLFAGCSIDPKSYETAPVTVASSKGPVVCQLYTKKITVWDRSITRPETMSVAEADAICLAEGKREQPGA